MVPSMSDRKRDNLAQSRARALRKRMTPSELVLWRHLRGRKLGVRFHRQEPIGPYIVDFLCRERRLIVEADGAHHEDLESDRRRDSYLRSRGYRVLRFWNADIAAAPEWVVEQIQHVLAAGSVPRPEGLGEGTADPKGQG